MLLNTKSQGFFIGLGGQIYELFFYMHVNPIFYPFF